MLSFRKSLFKVKAPYGLVVLMAAAILLPSAGAQEGVPPPPPPDQQGAGPVYAPSPPADFENRIPADQLGFLNQFANAPSGKVWRDKQFRRLMRDVIPNCEFHYGRDMPLSDALDMVIGGSKIPAQVRDGRYVVISGSNGPYLKGRGFIWVDLQTGIGLGGFYFAPTNGEPTPTVAVFSRQLRTKDKSVGLSQLPAAFVSDLEQWSEELHVPFLTTRYFLTGTNLRILLEHDEDFCAQAPLAPGVPTTAPLNGCERMNADAADIDLTAAYYLEQVHYATNATAWMVGGTDLVAWIGIRNNACRVGPNPQRCRVRMTRERTRMILNRNVEPRIH